MLTGDYARGGQNQLVKLSDDILEKTTTLSDKFDLGSGIRENIFANDLISLTFDKTRRIKLPRDMFSFSRDGNIDGLIKFATRKYGPKISPTPNIIDKISKGSTQISKELQKRLKSVTEPLKAGKQSQYYNYMQGLHYSPSYNADTIRGLTKYILSGKGLHGTGYQKGTKELSRAIARIIQDHPNAEGLYRSISNL